MKIVPVTGAAAARPHDAHPVPPGSDARTAASPQQMTDVIAVRPIQPPPTANDAAAAAGHPPATDQPHQAAPVKSAKKTKAASKKTTTKVFGGTDKETKEYIIENLSMLLNTGVTVGESLAAIAGELPKKSTKKLLTDMSTAVDEGMPFWQAIENTRLFNASAIALIQVGEESGRLPENLKVIAEQMHKSNLISAKIRSAMLYPAFLISLLFVVGTGVGVFLLPRLINILSGLQVQVGLFTRIVIRVGTFMGHYGILLAGSIIVVVIVLVVLTMANATVKAAMQAVGFRIPGVKKLMFETEMSRFGFILGTLLEAGLPVVTALQSLSDSMATRRYRRFAANLRQSIEEGNSFAKTFANQKNKKLLPGTIRQLIVSAEKSGNLSVTLIKIGQIYEDKADITARNLETLLEPIILVMIAVAVLFVALAVILPIYSLVGGINKH